MVDRPYQDSPNLTVPFVLPKFWKIRGRSRGIVKTTARSKIIALLFIKHMESMSTLRIKSVASSLLSIRYTHTGIFQKWKVRQHRSDLIRDRCTTISEWFRELKKYGRKSHNVNLLGLASYGDPSVLRWHLCRMFARDMAADNFHFDLPKPLDDTRFHVESPLPVICEAAERHLGNHCYESFVRPSL